MILYFVATLFKRSYKYLLLTFLSILVGAFLFGAILSITSSISNYLKAEGKTLVGGDIVLSSPRAISENDETIKKILAKSENVNREYNVQAVFKNVLSSSTAAANIRAVEKSFPLYGKVELENGINFSLKENENKIYVEKSFLDKINAKVGDEVRLGEANYKIAGIIKKEPDSVSIGISFTPKIIMLLNDFKSSGVNISQSRATYKLYFKEKINNNFTKEDLINIKNYAKENKIRFDDSSDGPNNLVRGLSSVTTFVSIIISIAIFLVVINIVANLSYLISKFKSTIALLKTFGATGRQIQIIYSIILGFIGIIAGFLGALSGASFSNFLMPIISNFLQSDIQNSDTFQIATLSSFIGLVIIITSSIPFFIYLKNISPKELLSKINIKNNFNNIKSFLYYLPIPVFLFLFLYIISSNFYLSLYSVLGLVFIFFFFLFISFIVVKIFYKNRENFSLVLGSSISSLKWRGIEALVVIASIMTAFSGIFILSAIEKNIIINLNQNVSFAAPSLYIVDINKSQLESVREISGSSFAEYPIIRGRLLKVNEVDMTTSDNPEITREFSMTYRNNLIKDEKITDGVWHGDNNQQKSVSIDNSFAEELGGVKIGDNIEVFVQGITIKATVTSLRDTERSSGTPFFFLVFSPDTLSLFPASYFATVSTDDENIKRIERELGNQFPNIVPIETGKIIDTVSKLLENVILIVKVLGVPSIILGLILIMIMTGQSLYERSRDVLILMAFGLSKNKIIKLFVIEVSFIVLLASIISYILAHIIAFVLNKFLFNFELFDFALTPIFISIFVLSVVIIFAYIIASNIAKSSLKNMLAEK